MAAPSFILLWGSYPKEDDPCDQDWDNQCAIRMSIALNAEGTIIVNDNTYREPKCKHGHARGAESLANWLWRQISRPKIFTDGAKAKLKISQNTGIIFFKDCFTRSGETARRGDHIDLWNKGLTKGYNDPANKASQVWFWELQ